MKLIIKDSDKCIIFSEIFAHIKNLNPTVTIHFMDDYFFIKDIDVNHVALYEIKLSKEWFDEYIVEDNDQTTISIVSEFIHKVMNIRDTEQTITWECNENSDKLDINFTSNNSDNKMCFDKFFELPIMDIDKDTLEIPDIDYDADMIIPTSVFATIMSQLEVFDESVEFECSEEKIILTAIGMEGNKMTTQIPVDSLNEYSIIQELEEPIKLKYSLAYIHKFTNFHKISNVLSINIGREYPIQFKYDINENSYARFFLAPKIDDE